MQSPATMLLVAPAMVHSLNNATASLFAVMDNLEGSPDADALARAKRALASACASTQALSAANHLLGIGLHAQGAPTTNPSKTAQLLDESTQLQLYEALLEIGDIRGAVSDSTLCSQATLLNLQDLKSLLICTGYALRKELGVRSVLRCQMMLADSVDSPRLCCTISAEGETLNALTLLNSKHPCALAVIHALASRIGPYFSLQEQAQNVQLSLQLQRTA